MSKAFPTGNKEFYLTAPTACPYLPGQRERKVFTFLGGEGANDLNGQLSQRGFRRSQNIAYLPACERCRACRPVRVPVATFDARPWRRTLRRNEGLTRALVPPKVTTEQFGLLRDYLDARHPGGGMNQMTVLDYAQMVEQTPVETDVHEYRDEEGRLLACALTDRVQDGLSMVYSFFDAGEPQRSLGSYVIVDHVARAREMGLAYVYLGYWVEGSPKMDYKRRFGPQEVLTARGWQPARG